MKGFITLLALLVVGTMIGCSDPKEENSTYLCSDSMDGVPRGRFEAPSSSYRAPIVRRTIDQGSGDDGTTIKTIKVNKDPHSDGN